VTVAAFLKLVVVALSLGLDVFAVCVGVGMRGADRAVKFRIGAAFCVAEISMVAAGAGIGRVAGQLLGDAAGYLGFAALVGVGIYMLVEALHATEGQRFDLSRGTGLLLGSLSISVDSLGIGFSILYIGVPFGISLVTIAAVSVASTTLGLALGRLLGRWAEDTAALWAGIVLIATGIGFAIMKVAGIGA
jgi:putative Mn2+ efflux pump MntP